MDGVETKCSKQIVGYFNFSLAPCLHLAYPSASVTISEMQIKKGEERTAEALNHASRNTNRVVIKISHLSSFQKNCLVLSVLILQGECLNHKTRRRRREVGVGNGNVVDNSRAGWPLIVTLTEWVNKGYLGKKEHWKWIWYTIHVWEPSTRLHNQKIAALISLFVTQSLSLIYIIITDTHTQAKGEKELQRHRIVSRDKRNALILWSTTEIIIRSTKCDLKTPHEGRYCIQTMAAWNNACSGIWTRQGGKKNLCLWECLSQCPTCSLSPPTSLSNMMRRRGKKGFQSN